ncbi:MAG: cysteine desulfurase [Lachnospiraceae bacterium]|nr:cysteine desulfurase [Lachnospiraceae bacterium]
MNVYLDNSATTRQFDEVTEYMSQIMRSTYGNPSSMHMAGVDAEGEIRKAKSIIAKELKVDEKEIFFTSGGTESDNLALIGCARANRRAGTRLITTATEHPAVIETMKYLEEEGFTVTYLDVDKSGKVTPDALRAAMTDDTILVSIMHVNNEIGSMNDIEELAAVAKSCNPGVLFHTDAVQSFGKVRIHPKRMKVDLVSVSAHKIHGPKGVGFIYIGDKVKIRPIVFGGGQQKGMRSGTENVPGIAGLGLATGLVYDDLESKTGRMYELKEYFAAELSKLPGTFLNGLDESYENDLAAAIRMSAPHIVSASFAGVRAEVLLHALEAKGICVSSGSACSSNKPAKSRTLMAIGLDSKLLDSTIRFSFSQKTTREELDYTLSVLSEELPTLRKFSRR